MIRRGSIRFALATSALVAMCEAACANGSNTATDPAFDASSSTTKTVVDSGAGRDASAVTLPDGTTGDNTPDAPQSTFIDTGLSGDDSGGDDASSGSGSSTSTGSTESTGTTSGTGSSTGTTTTTSTSTTTVTSTSTSTTGNGETPACDTSNSVSEACYVFEFGNDNPASCSGTNPQCPAGQCQYTAVACFCLPICPI